MVLSRMETSENKFPVPLRNPIKGMINAILIEKQVERIKHTRSPRVSLYRKSSENQTEYDKWIAKYST